MEMFFFSIYFLKVTSLFCKFFRHVFSKKNHKSIIDMNKILLQVYRTTIWSANWKSILLLLKMKFSCQLRINPLYRLILVQILYNLTIKIFVEKYWIPVLGPFGRNLFMYFQNISSRIHCWALRQNLLLSIVAELRLSRVKFLEMNLEENREVTETSYQRPHCCWILRKQGIRKTGH